MHAGRSAAGIEGSRANAAVCSVALGGSGCTVDGSLRRWWMASVDVVQMTTKPIGEAMVTLLMLYISLLHA